MLDFRLPNQRQQLFDGQATGRVGAFEEAVGEVAFCRVEGEDFVFDRTACDESINRDGAKLAHAVGSVGGLVFDGGIPPRIHVQYIVGGG